MRGGGEFAAAGCGILIIAALNISFWLGLIAAAAWVVKRVILS